MQQIGQGIYFEDSFLGVTVGALVYMHGIIFIDAPLRSEEARLWRSTISNYRGGANRLLVNLDAHPDRTLGARALECTIVAHQKAAQLFKNRPSIFKGLTVETGAVWETYSDVIGMRWASPDLTFTDTMTLHWGGPEIKLLSKPGPNPGSIWVVIEEAKTVFVGDTLVLNQPPFLAQADLDVWLENLNTLQKEYAGFQVVCGRGGLASAADIRAFQKLLKDVSDGIEKLGAKNAAPEAAQELAPKFLSKFSASGRLRDLYATRLRYGLHQCYVHRFFPATVVGQPELIEEEQ